MNDNTEPQNPSWAVRAVTERDLPPLKALIDATSLFPSAMLEDMIADYLAGVAGGEIWVTVDGDCGPVAVG